MKKLLFLVTVFLLFSCATAPLNERVKKILGDLSTYSDKKLLELYNRANEEIEIADKFLKNIEAMKRKETEVLLEGYVTDDDLGTQHRRERARRALEEWTEAKKQVLAEMEKRNLSPLDI